jgi:hypothetical protein
MVEVKARPDKVGYWWRIVNGGSQVVSVYMSRELAIKFLNGWSGYVSSLEEVANYVFIEPPDLSPLNQPLPEKVTAFAAEREGEIFIGIYLPTKRTLVAVNSIWAYTVTRSVLDSKTYFKNFRWLDVQL